jgi:hypothetical protein
VNFAVYNGRQLVLGKKRKITENSSKVEEYTREQICVYLTLPDYHFFARLRKLYSSVYNNLENELYTQHR